MKKVFTVILFFLTTLASQAFQDCVITNNSKLTDIKIEDNTVINVYPLITIMNDKNTLIVHPLKIGQTRFCVLKNNKNIVVFDVNVTEEATKIDEVEGFDILPLDSPPNENWLDSPPEVING